MEKKYTALRVTSVVFKVLAWIVAVFTIIGFIGMLVGGAALTSFGGRYGGPYSAFGGMYSVFMAFGVLIYGVLGFISLLAAADMILVILAIEENTRALKQTPPQM